MDDKLKVALCKAIIKDAFEYSFDSTDAYMSTMCALSVVLEFEGEVTDG